MSEHRHRQRPTTAAGASGARWSASTTRPGWRSSPAACTRPGVADRLDRLDRGAHRRRRRAGHPGRGAHRLPRVPRRPGQDAAPARCTPGILADLRKPDHARQLAELGIEPFDLVVVNLYPFARPSRRGASPRRVRRADRHRRPVDGARRRQEPPERRGRHLARRATARCSPPSRPAASTSRQRQAAGGRGVRAHRGVRHRGRVVDGQRRSTPGRRPQRLPGVGRRDVGARRRAALRREPAPARPRSTSTEHAAPGLAQAEQLHGKEMSYNNYVDADAARRAAYDFAEPAVAIIKHANPCGIAVGADIAEAHRKAHACDPVSRVRRRDRGQPAGDRWRWPSRSAEVFTEVVVAPAFETDALEVLTPQEEHPAAALPTAAPDGRRVECRADQRRAAACRSTDAVDARRRRPGDLDARGRRRRRRRDAGRPRVRLAARAAR